MSGRLNLDLTRPDERRAFDDARHYHGVHRAMEGPA